MIEDNNPEIDVEEIMAKIRAEIAGRKAGQLPAEMETAAAQPIYHSSLDWLKLKSLLRAAEEGADITNLESEMVRFPKPVRWLARGMSRVVNYLAHLITVRQTGFNQDMLRVLQHVLESLQNHDKALTDHGRHLSANLQAVGHLETQAAQLRAEFALIQRQFSELLEEGGERFSQLDAARQLEKLSKQKMHVLDALYSNFEDQFRGTREDVKNRVSVYLPMIKENHCGTTDAPVLDLGCGRGEWLEILKEENFSARGVDLNMLLVERCREMQLDVVESDIFEYLPSVHDAGIGAITAFHLVEHLGLGDLIRLIDECIRVLKPGGLLILETPNPENVLVGSCNFYYDPTHRNPVPPKLLKFLVESHGFYRVEILPLHPYGDDAKIPEDNSQLVSRFNDYFYGPQDYAVIGYKA